MNTDQIQVEIESAIPALMERVKQEALARIEREAVAAATAVATEAARKWAEENIAPEIAAQLSAGRDSFVAAANDAAKRISEALSDALVEQAKKAFANSYTVKGIAESMFKGY